MQNKSTKIKEIFTSIQGEGPYIGQNHIFVRFCKCNLNCDYCDTDFNSKNAKTYDIYQLFNELDKLNAQVISLTGGEPLMDAAFLKEFLKEFKPSLNKKIYLETNGLLIEQLKEIMDYIDIIAMDIKLQSATGQPNRFSCNDEFLRIASQKESFIKVVFDKNIIQEEIEYCTSLAKKYEVLLVLQPKMPLDEELEIEKIYNKFYEIYKNIRLIPQVHKFLNVM